MTFGQRLRLKASGPQAVYDAFGQPYQLNRLAEAGLLDDLPAARGIDDALRRGGDVEVAARAPVPRVPSTTTPDDARTTTAEPPRTPPGAPQAARHG